jgi:hypothetical protein
MTGMALVLILSLTASCTMLQELFADKVVTTVDNVTEAGKEHVVPADLNLLPADIRTKFEESNKVIVLVDKKYLLKPELAVDVNDPDASGWLDLGLGIAKTVFPGVAILEGLSLLFSQRKRKHYGNAVKQAIPMDGKIELVDAAMSIAKAIGIAHSSEGTKKTFKDEAPKAKTA